MASRILVVCIFRVTQLCNFTMKYVNSLAHARYYPCNRYQAFIFHTSIRPSVSLHTQKIRPGDEASISYSMPTRGVSGIRPVVGIE